MGAQTTGTLSGTITDATGAPTPNAAITVTPVNGGASQRVVAGSDGAFTITGLPPGTYRVEVESAGFKRAAVQNIDLVTGTSAQIRVQLQQGDTRETVEVQGSTVLVQQDNAELSRALDASTVTQLPLFDRNHQELVQLIPGVTPPRTTTSIVTDPQRSRIWETNGLSNNANRRTLDGVENEEPFNGRTAYVSPLESIQQVNLTTSNYDARTGRAAGTVIDPATRPGSNGFHGSAFEFNSNSAMSARNFFNPKGIDQTRFNQNLFGLSVGGPIRRDSTFFMVSYEGDLQRGQNPVVTTVPTADMLAGNFSAVPGLTLFNPATGNASGANRVAFNNNVIPSNQISPVARALAPFFPAPNTSGFENNLFTNVPYRNDGHRGDVRFDHKMGDRTNLFARWSYANYNTEEASALGLLGGQTGHLQNHNAMIGGTSSFSPSLIGDLRFSYSRWQNKMNSTIGISPSDIGIIDPSAAALAGAGFTNLGIPRIQIAGMQSFGTPAGFPQLNIDNTLNLVNSWSYVTGRHSVHAGFDVWGIRSDGFQNYAFGPTGGYAFSAGATASPAGTGLGPFGSFANSFAAFLLGAPSQSGRNIPTLNPSYWSVQGSLWVGDTFKATEKLTLDIGARWDVFSPLNPRRNAGVYVYDPTSNQLLPTNTGSVDEVGNVQTNWKNIGPRIGIAYHPMEHTVVRAGYGINFFNGPLNFYAASFITNPGVAAGSTSGFSTVAGAGSGTLNRFGTLPTVTVPAASTAPIAAPNGPVYSTPRDIRTPYAQQYNFMIEQDLGRSGLVASVGYVGNLGRELPYTRDLNAAAPGGGVAGMPFNQRFGQTASVFQTGTGLTSNYNALQASLTKRFSQSLSFTAAYTYSKALDYGPGWLTPLLNNIDIRSNYGPADWDRTHMFTLSHVWRIPIGANTHYLSEGWIGRILGPWQLDGVFRWVSGTPITLTADPTLCNCPGNTPTASTVVTGVNTTFVPIPTFFGFVPVPFQSLNFAFTQPAANSLGNLGRNAVRGNDFANYDLSLFRSFVIHEQTRFEFRGEAFNLTNSPHFANPIGNVNSASFGQSFSTLPYAPARRLQVSGRIVF